jgi:lysophospholipase L1-like esterase
MRLPAIAVGVILTVIFLVKFSLAEQPLVKGNEENGIVWYDATLLTMEGQGWTGDDLKAPFDRLPAKAEGKVRDAVWGLSRHSAGISVRFTSDAPAVHCRWTLTSANLDMPHMPATGVSGVDLYVKTGTGWRWLANGRPTAQTNTAALVSGLPAESREYVLYLPLYNGASSVEIGVAKDFSIAPLPRREARRPLVFWGTSITQGGCASRPGMVHTSILSRQLDVTVINLGFSGNGKLEPEMAELIAEIDAAAFVLDCLPNCNAAEVTERTAPVVAILRKAHPRTPIVLVEDRTYSNAFLIAGSRERNDTSRAALKAEYEKLLAAGGEQLFYIQGESLLGEDGEDTVDGSHPTDLGFLRQAEAMHKVLEQLVK